MHYVKLAHAFILFYEVIICSTISGDALTTPETAVNYIF